jgi:archaemetzincin
MSRFILIILCFSFLIISCNHNKPKQPLAITTPVAINKIAIKSIHILPLGNISKQKVEDVSKGLISFYHIEIIIEKAVPLEYSLLAKSKERYSADSILKKFSNYNVTLVLTEKDIVTKKDADPITKKPAVDEWGVFGLGNLHGKTTVISLFRLRRNATPQLLKERLQKVCIHEIGHNLNLNHCTKNSKCLMSAANGTIKQVDQEEMFFCENCRKLAGI